MVVGCCSEEEKKCQQLVSNLKRSKRGDYMMRKPYQGRKGTYMNSPKLFNAVKRADILQ